MQILEITEVDLLGRGFNGYDIMKQINRGQDYTARMKVLHKLSADPDVIPMLKTKPQTGLCDKLFERENATLDVMSVLSLSSPALYGSKEYKHADIAHYHQFHNAHLGFFELEREARCKPTVISFHDPWMMTGRCVHPGDCRGYENGCKNCCKLNTLFPFKMDMSAAMWNIKRDVLSSIDADIIVHSEYMYNLVKQNPYTKDLRVHLIPFGIDVDRYILPVTKGESRDRFGIPRDDFVLFFRAQEYFKGTEYIVEALKRFENTENITLLTCSQIGLLDEIKDKYRIIELGNVSSDTVKECFNACDVFLMPSIGESFGLMALEAMASAKPVVVFDNTALPHVTNAPDIGVLVRNLNSGDLYEKIKWLKENRDERVRRGLAGRELAKTKYSEQEYNRRIKEVYASAFDRQKYKLAVKPKKITFDKGSREAMKILYHLSNIYSDTFGICQKPIALFKGAKGLPCSADEIDYGSPDVRSIILLFNEQCHKLVAYNEAAVKPGAAVRKPLENLFDKKSGGSDDSGNSLKSKKPEKKMGNKKVSIVIPVYNGADYMREAIDSALAQTYDNIEVIVVNDGSADSTDEIARSYGDKIVYLKKENGGVSTALNLAIEKMTGDYFSWLSHDDRYYPQKIEREVKYLEDNGLLDKKVILYSDYDLMDENSSVYAVAVKEHDELIKKPEYCLLRGAINGLTLLIPKNAFEECGNFRTDLKCVQDYVLWEQMMLAGYRYIHLPEVLVTTRIHAKQQGNTSPVMVSEGDEFWIGLIKHTSEKRMIELEGSLYSFYKKMYDFMLTMPYPKALKFTENEYNKYKTEILNNADNICVTVAIPFANEVNAAVSALKSVLAQTHRKIEIMMLSLDSTVDISCIREALKADLGVTLIQMPENCGFADACNAAIENAAGEYLMFLDPNDELLPEKIKTQLVEMLGCDAEFSHTDYYKTDSITGREIAVDSSNLKGKAPTDIITDRRISFSSVMLKTAFLRDNGLGFSAPFRFGGDICFYLECIKKTDLLAIPEPLLKADTAGVYMNVISNKISGLKTVISYMLNNPEYANLDECLKRLSTELISYYYDENINLEIIESLFGDITHKKRGIISRAVVAVRKRGVVCTAKAGFAKIKRRLCRK